MRWSCTRATIGDCGASKRPLWKLWRSACLLSTLQTDRLMVTFSPPLQYKECAQGFVNQKKVCEGTYCAATNVSERESSHSGRFWGNQQLSLLSQRESSAKWHESATLAVATSSTPPCAGQSACDRRAPTTGSTYDARFHHHSSRT